MGEVVEVCVVDRINKEPKVVVEEKWHQHSTKSSGADDASLCTCKQDLENQDHLQMEMEQVNTQDDWLPITESRKGNSWKTTFHLVCSGIGFQALMLPVAFVSLGWFWGILCLSVAFVWQLYTSWLLVNLHEPVPGTRYSRYLHLSMAAFGGKLGKLLGLFPVMYLSGGTCVMLIITGGGIFEHFYKVICGNEPTCIAKTLTGTQWFLVFTCLAIAVALLCPNLNSLAGVSLLGAITAVGYCTMIWALSVSKGRPDGTSYGPSKSSKSEMRSIRDVLNALGIIALAFRGHNVVLEIQGTLPSSPKHPSVEPMWRGVKIAYLLIAICLFPLAIGGHWAYGNMIAANGGMMTAFTTIHGPNTSKFVICLIYVLFLISSVCMMQIYAMLLFDNIESKYTARRNEKCPKGVRLAIRVLVPAFTFFIAVAFPFLGSLGPLIGGITLPLTFAYPCFMWIAIKKPSVNTKMWRLNLCLGCLGIGLSALLVTAALSTLASKGLNANFFKPR